MLIDEHSVAAGTSIDTDICVIGAGPAGITFAREFIGSPVRVTVLESGRFDYDERIQNLGIGEVTSPYFDSDALVNGRRRQFGGTANLWTYETEPRDRRLYARCLPPESIDLTAPAGDQGAAWPVSPADLEPFYRRAQLVWNGAPFDYGVETWGGNEARPIDTANDVLETRICQHGPADVFYLRYRDDLCSAENVDLYLGCTAIEFPSETSVNAARGLTVARDDGSTISVAAGVYVVAGGGVENVQLLLSSEFTRPGAVGNRHDNIGRYVTTHPEFRLGAITPSSRLSFDDIALYDLRWVGRFMVSGFLTLSEEKKRAERLLNMSVALVPRGPGYGSDAHWALASLRGPLRRHEVPTHVPAHVMAALRSPRDTANALLRMRGIYEEFRGGWSRPEVDKDEFAAIELWAAPEQAAERHSRYSMSNKRDWLGRPQIRLEWHWSREDRDNIERSAAIIGPALAAAGLGTYTRLFELDGPMRPRLDGLHHPMGGTRMSPDPQVGVVDENCKIHGLTNVYTIGSSVFPTGLGYANPTLTLLALTLRAADHLKARLAISCD